MKITLHYDELVYYGTFQSDYQPSNAISPYTETGYNTTDYDYTIEFTKADLEDYLIDQIGKNTFRGWTREKQIGFRRAIELIFDEDLIFVDDVESWNKNLYDWLVEYYKEDAERECQKDYGD